MKQTYLPFRNITSATQGLAKLINRSLGCGGVYRTGRAGPEDAEMQRMSLRHAHSGVVERQRDRGIAQYRRSVAVQTLTARWMVEECSVINVARLSCRWSAPGDANRR